MTVTPDVVEKIARDDLVDLPDLVRVSGIPRGALQTAMREGLITPSPIRRGNGRGGRITFTREDAIFLLIVGALAIAAGVAFVTMLRSLLANGAKVSGNSVTLTLPRTGA